MAELAARLIAVLALSLRVAPVLAFAPPFTLIRVPVVVRVMLGVALTAWLVAGHPAATWQRPILGDGLIGALAGELLLGLVFMLILQIAFAAMLFAGRAIDIQAGFGLAMLVDPTTKAQMPMIGTLFAYAAGAIFFGMGGGEDLLGIWSASLDAVPLGAVSGVHGVAMLADYTASAFAMALGLAGLLLLTLLLLDLAIAFMSRTLPQMNVLVLGFQVKAIATLVMLPIALSLAGGLFVRLLRLALDTMPRML